MDCDQNLAATAGSSERREGLLGPGRKEFDATAFDINPPLVYNFKRSFAGPFHTSPILARVRHRRQSTEDLF